MERLHFLQSPKSKRGYQRHKIFRPANQGEKKIIPCRKVLELTLPNLNDLIYDFDYAHFYLYVNINSNNVLNQLKSRSNIIFIECFWAILPPGSAPILSHSRSFFKTRPVSICGNNKPPIIDTTIDWPCKISLLANRALRFLSMCQINSIVNSNKTMLAYLSNSDEKPLKISFIINKAI